MKTVLKIRCMYCGADMGEKDGVSHSICESCWYDNYFLLGAYPGKVQAWEEALKRKRVALAVLMAAKVKVGFRLGREKQEVIS